MGTKNLRLKEIRDIISNRKISKQEELLNILERRGYNITQATLSRDLSQLNVARKSSDSGSIYFIPEESFAHTSAPMEFLYGARSLRFSGNLGVLKTLPGYANSVGALIDAKDFPELLGTVAGNDTVLLILAENSIREQFIAALSDHFSNVSSLIQ
ncbi:MAG: arginine repressor [Bacteroidales bacterium]|nr:arginine repressor [Bacteroidales bacterium]